MARSRRLVARLPHTRDEFDASQNHRHRAVELYVARDAAHASASLDASRVAFVACALRDDDDSDDDDSDDAFDANACARRTARAIDVMATRCACAREDVVLANANARANGVALVFAHRSRRCVDERELGDVVAQAHDDVVDALRVELGVARRHVVTYAECRFVGAGGDAIESAIGDARVATTFVARATRKPRRTMWRHWLSRTRAWPESSMERAREVKLNPRVVVLEAVTTARAMESNDGARVGVDRSWPFLRTFSVADSLMQCALLSNGEHQGNKASLVDVARGGATLNFASSRMFSYADAFELATRCATFMRDVLRLVPGDVVGVLMVNSFETYVIHYACALARVVLVHLNTHLVTRELAYIVSDSRARCVFARERDHGEVLRDVVANGGRQKTNTMEAIVWIDDVDGREDHSRHYARGARNFDWRLDVVDVEAEDDEKALKIYSHALAMSKDAHLYYTSGTTGNPKGVCLTHEIVQAHADATAIEMRLGSYDTWLHAAPMFHLVDAFAIYCITAVRGRHVFLPSFDAATTLKVIAHERVTVCNFASSMVAIMQFNPLCAACDLSSLRMVSCGGSPLPPTAVRRAIALFGCEFFVSYGMTECCGKISMSLLSNAFLRDSTPAQQLDAICTSGRPFALMRVKVVESVEDEREFSQKLVPCDGKTVGEVFIKGPTVFAGYWKNPEATARAFDVDGWFNTGDLAFVRPDGAIVIVDRKKDMILSGGENVYCVEVERVLHACDIVARCAVFGAPHPVMGEVVHAMVTLREFALDRDEDEIARILEAHCSRHLSQYKCPMAYHVVDALPMNASGKVLKTKLRELVANKSRGRNAREDVLRRQFSRAVLVAEGSQKMDHRAPAPAREVGDDGDNVRAEAYETALTELRDVGVDEQSKLCLRGQKWYVFGAHTRIEQCLRSLNATVCLRDTVVDNSDVCDSDWLDRVERYSKHLSELQSGDSIVLADCLRCFATAKSPTSCDASEVASSTYAACGVLAAFTQALVARMRASTPITRNVRVLVLTSNAFVASDVNCTDDGHIAHSAVMAMLRVLRREHGAEISFNCLDAPHDFDHLQSSTLRAALRKIVDDSPENAFKECEVVIRDAVVAAPRLRKRPWPVASAAPSGDSRARFLPGASCVIVGGLGALGTLHFEFFAEHFGIERFVLVARSIQDSALDAVKRVLDKFPGVRANVVAADCSDERQARAVFRLAEPVAITVHLAGVLLEHAALDVTRASFVAGSEAKIIGSLNVCDALARVADSAAFVCSSSIFGHLGQMRLVSYAAANAFQDALCAVNDRAPAARARGGARRFIAISWGTWDERGMAHRSGDAFRRFWHSIGMSFLAPDAALTFVRAALCDDFSRACVGCFPNPADWKKYYEATKRDGAAFISDLVGTAHGANERERDVDLSSSASSDDVAASIKARVNTIDRVRRCAHKALQIDDIADDEPLSSAGATSARMVALGEALASEFNDVEFTPTVAFDYPTIRDLATFITGATTSPVAQESSEVDDVVAVVVHSTLRSVLGEDVIDVDAPLMSIGLTSTRAIQLTERLAASMDDIFTTAVDVPTTLAFDYPTARDVISFFQAKRAPIRAPVKMSANASLATQVLAEADIAKTYVESSAGYSFPSVGDVVTVAPRDQRWDPDTTGRIRAAVGVVPPFGSFVDDAPMFDAHAFGITDTEASIIDPQQRLILRACAALAPWTVRDVSVHVGVSQIEYPKSCFSAREALSPYYATSAHLSVAAGRVSYTFALIGAAEAIDTACSSSLVATHNARCVRASDGGSPAALAGGVNLTFDLTWTLACHAANMLASDGRCKTLDADADGYVRAEYYAMCLLTSQRSPNARMSNSRVTRVELVGTAVNQDGRSSSLTAPNGPSQTRCVRSAYDAKYIETVVLHGTGTPLGDPIEIGALRAANDDDRNDAAIRVCAIKSSRGHSEPASGIAGALLAVECVVASTVDALIHLRALNPHLTTSAERAQVFMPRMNMNCVASSASASAFAFQGTNAHALMRRDVDALRQSSVMARAIAFRFRDEALWLPTVNHAWITRGDVVYGRMLYVAKFTNGIQCAALRHHVAHGRPIAPGTALLELFIESSAPGVPRLSVGMDFVIPHALALVDDGDEISRDLIVNVLVRKHDGRVSVTTGPFCRPRTHLFGRIAASHREARLAAERFWVKGIRHRQRRQLFATISRSNASAAVGLNMDVYAADAAVHLAEAILQHRAEHPARVPAALAALRPTFPRDGTRVDRWMSSKTTCAIGNGARDARAVHDHSMTDATAVGLDIRPPFRRLVREAHTVARASAPSAVYVTSTSFALVLRQSTTSGAMPKDSSRRWRALTTRDARVGPRSISALSHHVQFHSPRACTFVIETKAAETKEESSSLYGALRSAAHEMAPMKTFMCVNARASVRDDENVRGIAGDIWVVPTFAHGAVATRALARAVKRDAKESDAHAIARARRGEILARFACRRGANVDMDTSMTVFGGLGALGARAASDFIRRRGRFVVLVGRDGRSSSTALCSADFQSERSLVVARRSDSASRAERFRATPNDSRIYASGVLADASVAKQSYRAQVAVCAPKFCVDDVIDVAAAPGCQCSFSSITALVGNFGQFAYGAANASLDARASRASATGVWNVSIQWGAWGGDRGMAAKLEARMTRIGVGVLSPAEGLHALRNVTDARISTISKHSAIAVSPFAWETYEAHHVASASSSFFDDVRGRNGLGDLVRRHAEDSMGEDTNTAPVRGAAVAIIDAKRLVANAVMRVLGKPASSDDAPFFELGMDSLSSVEFTAALDAELVDAKCPATLVFDYPTPKALVRYIESLHAGTKDGNRRRQVKSLEAPTSKVDEDERADVIALIRADVPASGAFTTNTANWSAVFSDGITRANHDRWNSDVASFAIPRFGGFLTHLDVWKNFDAAAFGMSALEAVVVDPQQRLALTHAVDVLHGERFESVRDNAAVFVGAATCDYRRIAIEGGYAASPYLGTGAAFVSVVAGRISFMCNLSGSSLAIDTACSSGLSALYVALHATSSLRLVAGVNALFDPDTSLMFANAGMLSRDGRCKTLESSADGYSRAEAAMMIALYRVRVGDFESASAILSGCAVNQDARSSSLTAPNGPSQTACVRAARMEKSVRHIEDLDNANCAVNLHGTGTPLGDPIEVGALLAAFAGDDLRALTFGATKAALAHSESPSGLIGLASSIVTLNHRIQPAVVHLREVNPYVAQAMQTTSVFMPRIRTDTEITSAGVSAFAFQGTNAHGALRRTHAKARDCFRRAGERSRAWHALPSWATPPTAKSFYLVTFSHPEACRFVVCNDVSVLDHRVRDRGIFPAAAYVELAMESSRTLGADSRRVLREANFLAPMRVETNRIDQRFSLVWTLAAFKGAKMDVFSDTSIRVANARAANAACVSSKPCLQSGAALWDFERHFVFGKVNSARDAATLAAEIDSAFHFIAATWPLRVSAPDLRIPATLDWFYFTDVYRLTGSARVTPFIDGAKSTHASRGVRARGLRTKRIAAARTSSSSSVVRIREYVVQKRRRIGAQPNQTSLAGRVPDARAVLASLQSPRSFARARVTADALRFGIYACVRSVALENSEMECRVEFCGGEEALVLTICRGRLRPTNVRNEYLPHQLINRVQQSHRPPAECLIITGGTGALGSRIAETFMCEEFSTVVAASRGGRTQTSAWHLDSFARMLEIQTMDSDPSSKLLPSAVVHAAGARADAAWRNITARAAATTFASKCGAFARREDADDRMPLRLAVVFSSIASIVGSLGQALYAASNEALDAQCAMQSHRGLNARALCFGPWADGGMARDDRVRARLRALGMDCMPPANAIQAFASAMANVDFAPVTCVASVDWDVYVEATGRWTDETFGDVARRRAPSGAREATTPRVAPSVVDMDQRRAPAEAQHALAANVEAVSRKVCSIIQRAVGGGRAVDVDAALMDAGVDSMTSIDLALELSREFDVKLPSTVVFDYPTPRAVATLIATAKASIVDASTVQRAIFTIGDESQVDAESRAIFIRARFASETKQTFDFDAIRRITRARWDVDDMRRDDVNAAAFMTNIAAADAFDGVIFGIHHDEASRCDCQHRMLLHAALDIARCLVHSSAGAYVGVASRDYADIAARANMKSSAYDATSHFTSVASGRISFVFDFRGEAVSIDTACSSALVAAHHARVELARHRSTTRAEAAVAGVNIILHPRVTEQFNRAHMLSPEGRCQTLDIAANGYVRAEACRMLRLSTLMDDDDDASDGIRAARALTLSGGVVNQDGRSSTLTAPNGHAQSLAIASSQHFCDGCQISMHLHGTGTPLGDPIEVNALATAISATTSTRIARVEASKTWIGHGEPASGIISMTSIIASHFAESTRGFLSLRTMNPYVAACAGDGALAGRTSAPFQCERFGASAFAFQGTNAHIAMTTVHSLCHHRARAAVAFARAVEYRRCWCEPTWFGTPYGAVITNASRAVTVTFIARAMTSVEACDHIVRGRAIFPGAGMLHAATTSADILADASSRFAAHSATIAASLDVDRETGSFEFIATVDVLEGKWTMCARRNPRGAACCLARVARQNASARRERPLRGMDIRAFAKRSRAVGIRGKIIRRNARDEGDDVVQYVASCDCSMQLAYDERDGLRVPVGADAYVGADAEVRVGDVKSFQSEHWLDLGAVTSAMDASANARIVGLRVKSIRYVANANDAPRMRMFASATLSTPTPAKPRREARAGAARAMTNDVTRCASAFIGAMQQSLTSNMVCDAEFASGLAKTVALENAAVARFANAAAECGHALATALVIDHDCRRPHARARALSRVMTHTTSHSGDDDVRIIGGLGALGALIAKSRAATERGGGCTTLSSRAGRAKTFAFDDRIFANVVIRAMACDASMRTSANDWSRTNAIDRRDYFVSGALRDGALRSHSLRGTRDVFAAKSTVIDVRQTIEARSQVFFSSIASLLGSAGQGNYAAANGAVDAIARRRRRSGVDVASIQFGPWARGGMATRHSSTLARLRAIGIYAVSANDGARALAHVSLHAVYAAAAFDVPVMATKSEAFATFAKASTKASDASMTLMTTMTSLDGERACAREDVINREISNEANIRAVVAKCVADALGRVVGDAEPLMHAGLDSLAAIDLCSATRDALKLDIPSTTFFDFPSISSASKEIARRERARDGRRRAATPQVDLGAATTTRSAAVVVVAISGETLATSATRARDGVRAVPLSRDSPSYDGAANAFGAFIPTHRVEWFDVEAFGTTSAKEALVVDPRQRMLVRATHAVHHRADAMKYNSPAIACFVGIAGKDYANFLRESLGEKAQYGAFLGVGVETSVASGRLAFIFSYTRAAMSVDTACSSSLVCAVLAFTECNANACEGARVAGASLMVTSDMHFTLGAAGMLSAAGRCKTFDRDADGYGRGEGVEVIACAREHATNDAAGFAVVRVASGAMNQDGRSASLTAPNGAAQRSVIEATRAKNGDFSSRASDGAMLLHTHGTGTALGDPIEMNAATMAYANRSTTPQASKSWVGHAEPASGALTIAIAIEQIGNTRFAHEICHLRDLNAHLHAAFEENGGLKGAPRTRSCFSLDVVVEAGASAFAFQGTNAHVVLRTFDMSDDVRGLKCFASRHESRSTVSDWKRYWPARAREVQRLLGVDADGARFVVMNMRAPVLFNLAAVAEKAFDDDEFALWRFIRAKSRENENSAIVRRCGAVRAFGGSSARTRRWSKTITRIAPLPLISRAWRFAFAEFAFVRRITARGAEAMMEGDPASVEAAQVRIRSQREVVFGCEHARGHVACFDIKGGFFVARDVRLKPTVRSRFANSRPELQVTYVESTESVDFYPLRGCRAIGAALSAAQVLGVRARASLETISTTHDPLSAVFKCARHEIDGPTLKTVSIRAIRIPATAPNAAFCGVHILGGTGAIGRAIARALARGPSVLYGRLGRCQSSLTGADAFDMVRADGAASSDAAACGRRAPCFELFHATGVLRDDLIRNQTFDGLRCVFAPKLTLSSNLVDGTLSMTATARHWFFSSVAALVAPAGQANYAASNVSLDCYASNAQRRGMAVKSMRWGAFDGVGGMANANDATLAGLHRYGLRALPSDVGLDILRRLLAGAHAQGELIVSPMFFDDHKSTSKVKSSSQVPSMNVNVKASASADRAPTWTSSAVGDFIAKAASELIGRELDRSSPMMEAGLDSISSVELRSGVSRTFDVDLPATVAFDYPTIDSLAALVISKLHVGYSNIVVARAREPARDTEQRETKCLSSVSRAGRFHSEDLLTNATNAAIPVPSIRWRVDDNFERDSDVVGMRFGAFIRHIDVFDRALFGSTVAECVSMDPQHRGILERAFECQTQSPVGVETFVAIGIQHFEYSTLYSSAIAPSPFTATGSALSVCAGRVSYVFAFIGSSLAVDTACSASLVTIHLAMESISTSTSSPFAMCGGVNYMLSKRNCDAVVVARMLAADGRCKTFDAAADGYGRGECAAAMTFASSPSINPAFAIVASACGQDGRSGSLTAPSGAQQRKVMLDAYRDLGEYWRVVGGVHVHGTGTALGDPIECGALSDVFRARIAPLALSASKASLGHAESAAGAIALAHVAASFAATAAPAVAGVSSLNPHVERAQGSFEIPRAFAPKIIVRSENDEDDFVTGASAFAFMGTNAHAVLRRVNAYASVSVRLPAYARASFWLAPLAPPELASAGARVAHASTCEVICFQMRRARELSRENAARLVLACASVANRGASHLIVRDVAFDESLDDEGEWRTICVNARSGALRAHRLVAARASRLVSHRCSNATWRTPSTERAALTVVARHRGAAAYAMEIRSLKRLKTIEAYYHARVQESQGDGINVTIIGARSILSADGEIMLGCRASSSARATSKSLTMASMTSTKAGAARSIALAKPVAAVSSAVFDALRDVFGEAVGARDDLMSKGLDSIGAVELATTLKRALGIERDIDVATLATQPTPLKLIAFLEDIIAQDAPKSHLGAEGKIKPPTEAKSASAVVKSLKSPETPNALFLGAPAFGDGPLAYMKLVDALALGAHPVRTLERDTTEQPWPDAARAHALAMHARQDDDSPIILGGHSLGGVLAIESALVLEKIGRNVPLCFLFDAPHPVQFKSDWNDVPDASNIRVGEDDASPSSESTGLTYMEVALSSFHFDTVAAGWQGLSREEKYAMFEDVAHQALGRKFNARELDEQISKGPYAAQWNSGMNQLEDGSIDSGAWRMLRGAEADPDLFRSVERMFSRVKGKVIHYKAGSESSALFETDLYLETNGELLQSVSGYVWPLACDHVEIVHCAGSHMNLMTSESNGGDLDETIVPHMRHELASEWDDLGALPLTATENLNDVERANAPWTHGIWHRELGLSMSASPALLHHGADDDDQENAGDDRPSVHAIVRAIDCEKYFDACAFGLNHDAVWTTLAARVPRVWLLVDVLADVELWSRAAFAATLPVHGIHLPRALVRGELDDVDIAKIAARCVGTIQNATLTSRDGAPLVVCAMHGGDASARVAFEISVQLNRRGGGTALAVVVDDGSPKYDRERREETNRASFQALAATLANTEHHAGWRALPQFLLQRHRRDRNRGSKETLKMAIDFVRAQRPMDVTQRAWDIDVDHAMGAFEALAKIARGSFFPKLILAHAFAFHHAMQRHHGDE